MTREGPSDETNAIIRRSYVRATSVLVLLWVFIVGITILSVWKPREWRRLDAFVSKRGRVKNIRAILTGTVLLTLAGCRGEGRVASPADAVSNCIACHTFNDGGAVLAGPNLYGILGTTAGVRPGFAYSSALKASGIVWTPATLDAFILSPAKSVPGNRMNFFGEIDAARRQAIVAYMQSSAPPEPTVSN